MDFAGRFLPNVVNRMLFRESYLPWCLLLRCVLIAFAFLTLALPDATVLNHPSFHVLLIAAIALSNGWLTTVSSIHLPGHVDGASAKSRASSMGLTFALVGVAGGSWTATLINYLRPKPKP